MDSLNSNNKTAFLLTRILVILLGIVALIWPGYVLGFLVYFFAFFAIIGSIGTIAVGISYSKEQLPAPRWAIILMGILGFIIGIATVAAPAFMTIAIIYFIGAWALVTGVADLIFAFTRASAGNSRLIMVLSGIISVLFGILVIFNPPILTAVLLVQVLGIYAILIGLLGVGYGLTEKKEAAAPGAAA
ncbi:MAG TPA: DUF308 domain-containing protein [Methanotrichaceae archaeon]|nr:DUF308 domain-containing protein [Methanotrichaceae archaeon]